MKDQGWWWSLTLRIFLTPITEKFPTYDVSPHNVHEARYNLNSVYQIQL
jgi:hypothetical protein